VTLVIVDVISAPRGTAQENNGSQPTLEHQPTTPDLGGSPDGPPSGVNPE
jgi:hypothetical protein